MRDLVLPACWAASASVGEQLRSQNVRLMDRALLMPVPSAPRTPDRDAHARQAGEAAGQSTQRSRERDSLIAEYNRGEQQVCR